MNEKDFDSQIRDMVKLYRWDFAYHTWNAKHSAQGFPDWVLVRDRRIVALELKGTTGKLTDDQVICLEMLRLSGKVEVYALWPEDSDLAVEILKGENNVKTVKPL